MKIIRITKNCALRFLEEAHKPGGRAEHLVEAHENIMFKDGAVNVLGSRKKHTTIVRFLPAMEMENVKLKEQLQSVVDGAKFAAFIDEAVACSLETMGNSEDDLSQVAVAVLKNIDGKTFIQGMSVDVIQFIADAYWSLRY